VVITEQAALDVIPGREAEFEEAFATAKAIIAASPGFVSLRLLRCIETPNRFLLLVEWGTLEDHTDGFRGSAGYEEWKRLLHHFYDPFPTVEHYSAISTA
jgi:heme-degrading monooxygenase HmoA